MSANLPVEASKMGGQKAHQENKWPKHGGLIKHTNKYGKLTGMYP